jgi:hypothetical protein
MERLPYIDEHARTVSAGRERTWGAVISVVGAVLGEDAPGPLTRLLRLEPAVASADRRAGLTAGDTLAGFAVEEASSPSRLVLAGRHRFSRYALVFELDESSPGRTRIRAQTWAEFPGALGRVYRALVIGTRAHRVVVRLILGQINGRAC